MRFQAFAAYLIFCFIFAGCGVHNEGIAPSRDVAPTPVPKNDEFLVDHNMKHGESVVDASGWEISIDTTDPVESITQTNGWQVEARYE